MTVRQALNDKHATIGVKVRSLVLCKRELFYRLKNGRTDEDSVYPVSRETAAREAKALGVPLLEA
jgi:hypothetical protein